MIGQLVSGLLLQAQAWWVTYRENRATHCTWCLHDVDPLDALHTARDRRIVHPGCKPLADADEGVWT